MTKRRTGRPRIQTAQKAVTKTPRWQGLALIVIVAATYAGSFNAPFIFDDNAAVVQNAQIDELSWRGVLSPPAETPVAGRPLVHLSFVLNHALGGFDPTGYHVVNLALHALCALLLFRLLLAVVPLTMAGSVPVDAARARAVAFLAALLWAVHPLNSEVVNYVTQRTESMMAICYLMVMVAAVRSHATPGWRWPAVAIFAALAGAACKESIATAPVMVVLMDRVFFFRSFRETLAARWPLYAGLAATWLALGLTLYFGGQSPSGGFSHAGVSAWTYLLNQAVMVTRYLWLVIWPGPLVIYYGWPQALTLADVWPEALFVCLLLAAAVGLLRFRPHLGFWAAWFFVTLAPTSSFLPIATEVGAERRMYLPLAGLIALAVIAAAVVLLRSGQALRRPWARKAAAGLALLIVGACALRAADRTREYASGLEMARTVLDRWPTPNAYQLVGTELATLGRHQEAVPYLREAVRGYPPAEYFLGRSLFETGDLSGAIAAFEAFIVQEPDALAARGAHGMLGDAFAQQGRFGDAIPHYREYLEARPDDAEVWNGLGVALAMTGDKPGAVDAFRGASRAAPTDARLRMNLARALVELGALDDAAAAAEEAVRLAPRDPAALDLMGRVLAAQGRLPEARSAFQQALSLNPAYAPALEALRAITPPK